jgi:hypothetical protein
MARDRIQWLAVLFVVLKRRVLIPKIVSQITFVFNSNTLRSKYLLPPFDNSTTWWLYTQLLRTEPMCNDCLRFNESKLLCSMKYSRAISRIKCLLYRRWSLMMMTTEMVLETSVSYRHLTWLIARDFIEFSRHESSKSNWYVFWQNTKSVKGPGTSK